MGATTRAPKLIGVGAGGHAKNVIDAIVSSGRGVIAGLLDADPSRQGDRVLGVGVLGTPADLDRYRRAGIAHAFVGVGGVPDPSAPRIVFDDLSDAGFHLPPIAHPRAVVSRWAIIGAGCQVLAGAVVNADAQVGQGAVVGTGAIVGHDAIVGAHAHVAAGARIGGATHVGAEALIGAGAIVLQGVRVGDGAAVGAGAVVTHDVPDGSTVLGIPAVARGPQVGAAA